MVVSQEMQSEAADSPIPVSSEIQSGAENAPMLTTECDRPGAENAPMVVEHERPVTKPVPQREADKEVISSWQTQSGEENAPIAMQHHESSMSNSTSLDRHANDAKGVPPAYDDINDPRNNALTSPRSLQPDADQLSPSSSTLEPDGGTSPLTTRPEDRSAVGQLLSWIPSSPRALSSEKKARLTKPVVIPQLDVPPVGESVPFQRCYSDALAAHDVSVREFVAFLDGLAMAQAPNSALKGLNAFGVMASHIPIPLIPLAGKGISALATSTSGHSGGRARLYLARANKEYFAPRGLHLNIVRDEDISTALDMPRGTPILPTLTRENMYESVCERRFAGLGSYTSPLRYKVPPPDKNADAVEKMVKKHLDYKMRKKAKGVAELREQQWEAQAYGKGKATEAALEEEKMCRRLKWLVIEENEE